jgi:hypothetical protein
LIRLRSLFVKPNVGDIVVRTHRFSKPRLAGALSAMLLIGGSLAQWSPVGAQTLPVQPAGTLHAAPGSAALGVAPSSQSPVLQYPASQDPVIGYPASQGPATQSPANGSVLSADGGFTVVQPSILTYYQQHGGARILGQPISHDFQLLGRRVQIFDQQVLQQRPDGSVHSLDILGDTLPLTHAGGATFPSPDPDIVAGDPDLDSPMYQVQALDAINNGLLDWAAPDSWNDLPVNFGATFRSTVTCTDLPPSQTCDDRRLLGAALDVWGLPTSAPAFDPNNSDLVYLRFQRGIMQYSQSSGLTQAVPVGDWFKRVLIGTEVPDDLLADVIGSRYFAQYSPSVPLGVSRPSELPATSLAVAFSATTSSFVAADVTSTPTPVSSVFAPALPDFNSTATPTPVAFGSGTADTSSSTTPTVVGTPGTPTVTTSNAATTAATPSTPVGPDPCAGDEQMYFSPPKPFVGTDVLVSVTSATHHDMRTVRLTGPVKTGQVSERAGLNGWVWEWTISPTVDGWYDFTFFTDGARACATSGFNALPAFGTTPVPATPTAIPFTTATPIATMTATPTVGAPSLAASNPIDPATGACAGRLLRIVGTNFGATQAALQGNVLFASQSGSAGTSVATILSWTENTILLTVPTGSVAGPYQIVVTTTAGASSPLNYTVGC